ncbi:glycosyltransferase family 4 protein [Candidatus Micrarchaeota archaeon]|nr:glycosyltransferase family 4 protein [Candidatus Micrarchaeota archaeon]
MSKDLLAILAGTHPVHLRYVDELGSDRFFLPNRAQKKQFLPFKAFSFLQSSFSIPGGYRTLFTENCYFYPALKKRFGLLKSKIINLNSGPLFYNILHNHLSSAESRLLLNLCSEVDGFLVQGRFGRRIMEQLDIQTPLRITYPFILDGIYSELTATNPQLNGETLTIFATNDFYYKGIDILMDAFSKVCKAKPNVKLNIGGNLSAPLLLDFANKFGIRGNLNLLGFVPNVSSFLGASSLYVQPSRGETFGVAVLEAMAAGVPAIVSQDAGVSEVVESVDSTLISSLDSDTLAKKILDYLDLSDSKKQSLSKKSRLAAATFREKPMCADFKKQFLSLLD